MSRPSHIRAIDDPLGINDGRLSVYLHFHVTAFAQVHRRRRRFLCLRIVEEGGRDDFFRMITPRCVNHMVTSEGTPRSSMLVYIYIRYMYIYIYMYRYSTMVLGSFGSGSVGELYRSYGLVSYMFEGRSVLSFFFFFSFFLFPLKLVHLRHQLDDCSATVSRPFLISHLTVFSQFSRSYFAI